MNRFIDRLKIFFIGVFLICCIGIWTLHLVWIWPGKRCEAKGMWWDWRERVCALPVPLQVFTGRAQEPVSITSAPRLIKVQPER